MPQPPAAQKPQAMAAAGLEREANDAFGSGAFELAVDLYTQAIDAGLATADVYADRARARVLIGNYHEALEDSNKALELDPLMSKAYLGKVASCINLKEFQKAKAALQKGSSIQPCDPRFTWILEKLQNSYAEEANNAYNDGNFGLATELLTEAIDDGPASAELYTLRARANLKLGYYDEAIEDADKGIKLDPNFLRAYLIKCTTLYMLKRYQTAKAVIEVDSPCGSGDHRFDMLLRRCDQRIGEEAIAVREKIVPPSKLKEHLEEAPSAPIFKCYFYNTPTEIVVVICAKGAKNLAVEFGDQTLSGSFDVPDEEPYRFHMELSSKIIPDRSTHRIFSKVIQIHLAKVENSVWRTLSNTSIPYPKDYEFSWKTKRLNGQNILPQVRDQGQRGTCVFQSLTAAAEVEFKKKAAIKDPPESLNVKFSTNEFICDYERAEGCMPHDNPSRNRTAAAIKMFEEVGVLARGKGIARGKIKLKGHRKMNSMSFEDIKKLIKQGRPVVGSLRMDESLTEMKPGEIYDYTEKKKVINEVTGNVMTHAVVFIGFGVRDGRAYLVFLNSWGNKYCEEGFGRVFF